MRIAQAGNLIEDYVTQFNMRDFLNDDLLQHLQLFRFLAYSNIYLEQDEQHFFYFLVEGQVQCSHYHLNGTLSVIAISQPFAAIGDVEILNQERVNSNVIAIDDVIMLGIAADVVNHYGAEDPRFLRFLIDQLRQKLYKTNALQMNAVLPVINRLALYILSQPVDDDGLITLPGKEELAALMGTTTRHLNRVLKSLIEARQIDGNYPHI
ncbi:MAG: Crp/Fnr family transcriptional regulator, partial [Aggregatilineales bacterium]